MIHVVKRRPTVARTPDEWIRHYRDGLKEIVAKAEDPSVTLREFRDFAREYASYLLAPEVENRFSTL